MKGRKMLAVALISSLIASLASPAFAAPATVAQNQQDGVAEDVQPAAPSEAEQQEEQKPKVETIEIVNHAPDDQLTLGSADDAELTLTAVARDKDGNVLDQKKIVWKSENNKVAEVDKEGKVTAVGVGTAEIVAKMENVSTSFQVTVKDKETVDREQAIRDAIAAIDALPPVDQLTLADKPAVADAREKVNAALGKGAQEGDITNLQDLVAAEEKIAALERDAADVAADKAALAIGYADGDSENSVTQNVTLPNAGANGSTIGWASGDTAVISENGQVTRPAHGSGDKQVTLTATLAKGGVTDQKEFILTVKELPAKPVLSVQNDVIAEAAANDGSIGQQQVVSVQNGTFAADLSKADIRIDNLPAGLDFQLASAGETELTIAFTGNADRHYDADDARVTVTIAAGKVSGTAEELATPPFTVDFHDPATVPIPEAKMKVGETVSIMGIVTADNAAIGGGKLSTFIQEGSSGINVFNQNVSAFPELKEGDEVFVTGKITVYRGLTEIVAERIEIVSRGNSLPEPQAITLADLHDSSIAEPLEGTLVKAAGYISNIPGSPAGSGYNISFIDAQFRGTTLRVMEGSMDVSRLQQGKWYEATAILGQFDSGYQLLPRKEADVVLLHNQPDPPDPSGTYDSAVSEVVDGDTIHLTQPVLGTGTVRFVNVDTPETYHVVRNDLDQNQKDHGLRAKQQLISLLAKDEQVQVKVGEKAMDDYGRLLGEVVRKRDNMLTNLEMVRSGYASTYFIWPIDEQAFEMYQQAAKEAELEGLGIWNPDDPLLELPFVFRAREQQRGLSRHVGNYHTKKYVSPENWFAVPYEERVFFNSIEEAVSQGYTAASESELADALAVANAKAALKLGYDGTAETIQLPAAGTEGTTIEWAVKDPSQANIIDVQTGAVNRAGLQTETTVILIATIKKGTAVDTKGVQVRIQPDLTDEQAVAAAKAALQVTYDGVAATVALLTSGEHGTTIAWSLKDPAQAGIVDVETGAVTRTGLTADTDVVLIAAISKGSAQDTKEIAITVKPVQSVADLFFSEYLEGSSNNKALEIFNGTGSAVDLAAGKYAVALFANGSPTPTNTFTLTGTLADGQTFVIANAQANPAILAKAQATSSVTFFNGDDALVLYKNFDPVTKTGTVVDVIGVVGSDPGTAWGTTERTVDQTLVRKSTVHAGNTNPAGPFDPAAEWESKGLDYFDSLGSHSIAR